MLFVLRVARGVDHYMLWSDVAGRLTYPGDCGGWCLRAGSRDAMVKGLVRWPHREPTELQWRIAHQHMEAADRTGTSDPAGRGGWWAATAGGGLLVTGGRFLPRTGFVEFAELLAADPSCEAPEYDDVLQPAPPAATVRAGGPRRGSGADAHAHLVGHAMTRPTTPPKGHVMPSKPTPYQVTSRDTRDVELRYLKSDPPVVATPSGANPLPVRRVELCYSVARCELVTATAFCDRDDNSTCLARRLDVDNLPEWLAGTVEMYRPVAPLPDLLTARIAASVDWQGFWSELSAHVQTAITGGNGPIDPAQLDEYMTELHRRFVGNPTREAIRVTIGAEPLTEIVREATGD
jgi:hypothetical protein